MRNFLAAFLILIMCTPALACAMPVCPDQSQSQSQNTEPPCPGHVPSHSDAQNSGDPDMVAAVMLLKDCMGVDLQLSDKAPALEKAGGSAEISYLLTAAAAAGTGFVSAAAPQIRAPPPEFERARYQPPLLLITGRFRI